MNPIKVAPLQLNRAATRASTFLAALALGVGSVWAIDLVDEFDGDQLDETVWEQIGAKTVAVADGRLNWADDGGNWADGEIATWQEFYLPPPGETTSIPIIPADVSGTTALVYTLTVAKGGSDESRSLSLSVSPQPDLAYDDFLDDFDGDAIDTTKWEIRGPKTYTVADNRVNWNDDGNDWDHGEIDSIASFPLPPRGSTTTVKWVLGPAGITTDIGSSSIRYQFGIFSYHETHDWTRENWQNSTGGIWLDASDINSGRPDGVSGGVMWADDRKAIASQYPWLSGFSVDDWNWQTDSHEFSLVLTDLGFTWYSGEAELYTGAWADINIDNEFTNGFKIMVAGMNYDTGRGPTSLERVEVENGAVPGFFNIVAIDASGPNVQITWDSSADAKATYTVQRKPSVGLDWEPLAENLPGQGETTSYTDTAAPDGNAFYQVAKLVPPPLLEAGFEPDEDLSGWTEVVERGGSQWEVGPPTSGPGAARSGANVYATVLAGDYGNDQTVGLRTPIIDLGGVDTAVLQFYHYYELEFEDDAAFDWGEVNLLDTSGNNLLPGPALRVENASDGWKLETIILPDEALGNQIRVEFKLSTDNINTRPGWYIDDVLID